MRTSSVDQMVLVNNYVQRLSLPIYIACSRQATEAAAPAHHAVNTRRTITPISPSSILKEERSKLIESGNYADLLPTHPMNLRYV